MTSAESKKGSLRVSAQSRLFPLYWLPGAILLVTMLVLVHLYGVNIPINDDFNVPGHFLFRFAQGDFQWRYLWELNNFSRLVVPKLICLAEACTVGWANKHWSYGAVVLAFLQVCLAIALLRKTGANRLICWSFSIFAALLLLHPGNAPGALLRGGSAAVMFPGFFLILGSYFYTREMSYSKKLAIYGAFSFLGTLSFANGMILWLLLFPLFPLWHEIQTKDTAHRRKVIINTAIVCVLGLLVIAFYFQGFQKQLVGWDGWSKFVNYYCTWLGASLASRATSGYSFVFGLVMLILALALGVLVLAGAAYRRTTKQVETAWPWLLLLAYEGISGIANTFGRQKTGILTAMAPRYFLITLLFPLALGGLLSVCARTSIKSPRKIGPIYPIFAAVVLLAISIFSLITWGSGWQRSFGYYMAMKRCELGLRLWRQAPDIYPLPLANVKMEWRARARTHYFTLVDSGFLEDLGRDEWLRPAMRNAMLEPTVGEFSVGSHRRGVVRGWAINPLTGLPFPAVVAATEEADGSMRVINVALMTSWGPLHTTRSSARDTSHFMVGFALSPLAGVHPEFRDFDRLRVFAIDPTLKEAYPLRRKEG